MLSSLLLITSAATMLILGFNVIFHAIRWLFFSSKASIDPKKHLVVITGCDSGFGEMSAVKLSAAGYRVLAGCLTKDGVSRLNNTVACAIVCDITKDADVSALCAKAESLCTENGWSLWAVVNNAGIAMGGPLDWISMDVYYKIMEVNFFGHVRVTKAMLPLLKRQKNSRIINLSSIAGIGCSANLSAYGASKHAIEGFMKSVREELRPWGIHVSNINPGFMRTPMVANNVAAGLKTFESTPEEIRSQYVDPRPKLFEGNRLVDKTLEDPILVVKAIEDAVSDLWPSMWYFPGYSASIMRATSVANSATCDFFISYLLKDTVHNPTPEGLKRFREDN